MTTICVVGATGATGRRVAQRAAEQGLSVVLAGRSRAKLETLATAIGGAEVRVIDLDQPGTLDRALDGSTVVASCVGPFTRVGWPVVEAALRSRVHYVDTTGEPRFCLSVVERLDGPARQAGVALVSASGASSVPADLAAASALAATDRAGARELTIAYRITGMRPTAGTVRSSIHIAAGGAVAMVDGKLMVLPAGGGPRTLPAGTGVRFACPDSVVISRYCPLPFIDTFVVLPGAGLAGPVMGLSQHAMARPGVRERLCRLADRLPAMDDGRPHGSFAVDATVWGRAGAHTTTAVASDVYGFTAAAVVHTAQALAGYQGDGGVLAPSQVTDDIEKSAVELGVTLTHRVCAAGEPVTG